VKIVLSIVWLVLAVVLFGLGRDLSVQATEPQLTLETKNPRFEIAGEGFHLELDVSGTPLSEPFEEFEREVNAYLSEVKARLETSRRRAALGCYAGAAASLLGLLLVWQESFLTLFRGSRRD
jgi:hypothetical protein